MDDVERLAIIKSIATVVREQVAAAVANIRPVVDYGFIQDNFEKSICFPKVENGKDGAPGKDGADGKSVTVDDVRPLFEAEIAKWLLEFERRANDTVQKFLEKIPKPLDGKDGFGFDDMTVLHDGERLITLRFTRGADVKEFPIEIPALIERGVFKRGDRYARGDGVSYGGSFWIAQCATDEVPGDGATNWRLAVKKGRDGKDGRDGDAPRIVKFGAK